MLRHFLPLGLILVGCYEKEPPAASDPAAGSPATVADGEDHDGDGYSELTGDCNDVDPTIYPDAVELCDKLDNDCDGLVDNNIGEAVGIGVFHDEDRDGFGDAEQPQIVCEYTLADAAAAQISTNDRDCNDDDQLINPGAKEVCDEIDNDCDEDIDEDPVNGIRVYADNDADGYGDGPSTGRICEGATPETGSSLVSTDCDDEDPNSYPEADEYCNEQDNDCDGYIDNDALDKSEWFLDSDGDGYGAPDVSAGLHCSLEGWASNADDCDDADAAISPDAEEVCDGVDNDCNGGLDEGLTTTYYLDSDGDSYGDSENASEHCEDPGAGYADDDEDCNDADATINPGVEDIAGDEIDQNCDGTELCFVDADDDGVTSDSPEIVASDDALCSGAGEALATDPAGDCDDSDPTLGSSDLDADCDGVLTDDDCNDADETFGAISADVDCDGVLTDDDCNDADETLGAVSADADCDGVLTADDCDDDDAASTVVDDDNDCDGFITAEDCDDDNDAINPDAYDVLDDGVDNNCDGGDWVTCDDDFIIAGSDPTINIAALEFCGAVTGLVYLYDTGLTDTSGLSRLRSVGGLEMLDNAVMTSISLPSLTSVGDDFFISDNTLLSSITMGSLETIGGNLNVMSNDSLTSIDAGPLSTLGQDFVINANPMLTDLTADSLSSIGDDMWIAFNDALTGFSTSAVTTIGNRLEIQWNSSLEAFDLGALEAVGNFAAINGNDSLTAIALNNLTATESYLEISDNAVLSAIELDALVTAPQIDILDNSSLCQSVPDTLETELLERSWSGLFTSLNNLDDC